MPRVRISAAEKRWIARGVEHLPWWKEVDEDAQTVIEEQAPDGAVDFEGVPAPEAAAKPDLGRVLQVCEAVLGLGRHELGGPGRRRYTTWCRCLVTAVAVGWLGIPSKDLAAALGKTRTSVSRWLTESHRLSRTDPGFRRHLENLEREISKLPVAWLPMTKRGVKHG